MNNEQPIIIWTFRRTGGTSLATFLFQSSSYESVIHEPFNVDRIWGDIAQKIKKVEYKNYKERYEQIQGDLANYVAEKKGIKHTIDTVPPVLTKMLLAETVKQGYKHIVLIRENQFQRILSLELAKQTAVWGKKGSGEVHHAIINREKKLDSIDWSTFKSQFHADNAYMGALLQDFSRCKIPYEMVSFEQLYDKQVDQKARFQRVYDLLEWLHIENYDEELLSKVLLKSSQNTERIYDFLPNYKYLLSMAELEGMI